MVLAVMVALFLASLGAELAGVEKIVGAFLAGLAVNSVLPEGRVKEQVIFLGGVLFIPIFFIDLGLLLDLGSLGESFRDFRFTGLLLVGAIGGKGLASWISGKLFGYRRPQILMMWSLTMPKVAATLATAFIGYQAGLLNQTVLNSVLAVMVVTATLGPILTERSVQRLMDAPLGMVPTSFGEEAAAANCCAGGEPRHGTGVIGDGGTLGAGFCGGGRLVVAVGAGESQP
jgi:Kef-type K+ transport system membrane component KefB